MPFIVPTNATANDFTEMTHHLYDNIKILRHDPTGYFRITDIANNFNAGRLAEYEETLAKIPSLRATLKETLSSKKDDDYVAMAEAKLNDALKLTKKKPSEKKIADWNRVESTKEFLEDLKTPSFGSITHPIFTLNKDVPNDCKGTYAHKSVLHNFLHWMDSRYAFKVGEIISYHIKTELEAKQDSINLLRAEMKQQSEEAKARDAEAKAVIEKQSSEIAKLLGYATETKEEVKKANHKLGEVEEKVVELRETVEERKPNHTINPKSITKLQYIEVYQHMDIPTQLYVARGQKSNIKKQRSTHGRNNRWRTLIEMLETPNAIKAGNRIPDLIKIDTADRINRLSLSMTNHEMDKETFKKGKEMIKNTPRFKLKANTITFDKNLITIDEVEKLLRRLALEHMSLATP